MYCQTAIGCARACAPLYHEDLTFVYAATLFLSIIKRLTAAVNRTGITVAVGGTGKVVSSAVIC